jgi:hypothetical protein
MADNRQQVYEREVRMFEEIGGTRGRFGCVEERVLTASVVTLSKTRERFGELSLSLCRFPAHGS